jgi:hypothetical protein
MFAAKLIASSLVPRSIALLPRQLTANRGDGVFGHVTYIQRLATSGDAPTKRLESDMQAIGGLDGPRSVAWRGDAGWWYLAACVGHDPEWWSDDTPMLAKAVRICFSCPVRRPCLVEALRNDDVGVIRGGMLIERAGQRSRAISLACSECCSRPARVKKSGGDRYCGPRCRAAAGARALNDPTPRSSAVT